MISILPLLWACSEPASPPAAPPGHPPDWYHEASWDDVRARVVGHLAAQGRDLARLRAGARDWTGCAAAYGAAAVEVAATTADGEANRRVRDTFARALERDGALCAALARSEPVALPSTPLAAARARHLRGDSTPVPKPVFAMPALEVARESLARATRRAELTELWADEVDPLEFRDPWGYWTPDRQESTWRSLELAEAPALEPWTLPAGELWTPPTGDTYVDSAGLPGLRAGSPGTVAAAPGDVERAARLARLPPSEVAAAVEAEVQVLASQPDGERRVRMLRNAALRHLARAGAYAEAARLAASMRDPRPFDLDCPDRAGVVLGIEGRLLALAGDARAEETLLAARSASRRFLAEAIPP